MKAFLYLAVIGVLVGIGMVAAGEAGKQVTAHLPGIPAAQGQTHVQP